MKIPNLYRRSAWAWLLVWGLTGLSAGVLSAQERPAPLDPLTPSEIQNARGIANLAPAVNSRISGRRHILGSIDFLLPPKPEDPSQPVDGRYAQALYCVYAGNTGFRALVDLVRGIVLSTEELSCDEVPIAPEEVLAARDLAVANPAVREFLGVAADSYQTRPAPGVPTPEHLVEAMKVVATEAEDRCFGQRCLLLIFSDPEDYRTGLEILVNMTNQTVTTTPVEPAEFTSTHAHRTQLKAKAGKAPRKTKAPGKGNG
jgi:hypothetical protein